MRDASRDSTRPSSHKSDSSGCPDSLRPSQREQRPHLSCADKAASRAAPLSAASRCAASRARSCPAHAASSASFSRMTCTTWAGPVDGGLCVPKCTHVHPRPCQLLTAQQAPAQNPPFSLNRSTYCCEVQVLLSCNQHHVPGSCTAALSSA